MAVSDGTLQDPKARARKNGVSLTKTANRVLRTGLAHLDDHARPNRSYSEPVADLGQATVDLDRALRIAAELEDRQVLRKLEEPEEPVFDCSSLGG